MVGMPGTQDGYRLYQDLASWWPLISPPQEYAEEAAYLAMVLRSARVPVREVLDLGSGGGHIAVHLKDRLSLTLVDISEQMLSVSGRLNPQCAHRQGDMRTVRLGRAFDAVLVHDAADYLTTEADLRQAIETAFAHCRPGGIALFVPDHVADTFRAASGSGGGSDQAGRRAFFRERTWDPDPADTWIQAEYEFRLRAADGTVQVVHEAHRLGAFSRDTWLRLLAGAGFDPADGSGPDADPHDGRDRDGGPRDGIGTGADPGAAAGPGAASGLGAARGRAAAAGRPRNLFIGHRTRPGRPSAATAPSGG
jgi:SAM-dependent methyltransferase